MLIHEVSEKTQECVYTCTHTTQRHVPSGRVQGTHLHSGMPESCLNWWGLAYCGLKTPSNSHCIRNLSLLVPGTGISDCIYFSSFHSFMEDNQQSFPPKLFIPSPLYLLSFLHASFPRAHLELPHLPFSLLPAAPVSSPLSQTKQTLTLLRFVSCLSCPSQFLEIILYIIIISTSLLLFL